MPAKKKREIKQSVPYVATPISANDSDLAKPYQPDSTIHWDQMPVNLRPGYDAKKIDFITNFLNLFEPVIKSAAD